jgi:hypothetical protein
MNKTLIIGGLSSLLAAVGCGDNDSAIDENPAMVGTEITLSVIPAADLAANGGNAYVGVVAFQDGDGPWQAMESSDGGYRATVKAQRFGVAVGCKQHLLQGTTLAVAFLSVQHATVGEGTALSDFTCVELAKPHKITGTATGLPSTKSVFRIGTGEGSSNTNARADGFAVSSYAAPTDVVGYYDGGSPGASKVVRVSDVDPVQNAPILLDCAAAGATPVTSPVTVPAGGPPVLVSAHVRNHADGRYLQLWSLANQQQYSTMPRALLRTGDLIRVGITSAQPAASREAFVFLAEPGPVTLELGAPFTPPSPTLAKTPAPLATFSVAATASALPLVSYQLTASTRAGTTATSQVVTLSQAWLKDRGSSDYQLPDLSAVPGWERTMALSSGAPVRWETARYARSAKGYEPNLELHIDTVSGELAN